MIFSFKQIRLLGTKEMGDMHSYVPSIKSAKSSEWTLVDFLCKYETIDDISGLEVVCRIKLQRRSLYCMFNIVMPCMLLLFIGALVFCLNPSSGERVSLAITVLLAMMVFQLVVMENIPPTSKVVPLLGKRSKLSYFNLYMENMIEF